MNRDAFAAGDVADDLLAADRIAAPRAKDHQVVEAANLDLLFTGAEHPPDHGRNGALRGLFAQLFAGHQLDEDLLRLDLPVPDCCEHVVDLADREVGEDARKAVAIDDRFGVQIVPARFLVEQFASELDRARFLLRMNQVLDLVAGARGGDESEPVAARFVRRLRDDLDDVAVLEARAERHHLAVDAGADALMADVGVNRVGEIDRRGAARQRFHETLRREGVHLLGVQLHLEVLDELLWIGHFLLHVEELPHPLEIPLVALIADAAFLVFPVRGDALFRHAVHFNGADLDLERHAVLADHRGVQRLVPVRPRHRDEVLDAARHRRPRLVNDAEHAVAFLHALGDDPQRDEVVYLFELDLLALQLLADAPQPLDAAVNGHHRHLGLGELRGDGLLELLDQPFRGAAARVNFGTERLVRLWLEVAERQLLELVLDLAHAQAVRDGRIDVAGFLCNHDPPLLRQMVERPHVVQPVGELDEDDADVVDHRQEHLAEVLRLPFLAGRKRNRADLGHALDDVRDLLTEELFNPLNRRERVFDDIVEEPGGNGDRVELHVGQKVGDGKWMNQVGFTGMAYLSPMLERREDIGAPQQLNVGVRTVGPDLFEEILEANHGIRCLK